MCVTDEGMKHLAHVCVLCVLGAYRVDHIIWHFLFFLSLSLR